MLMPEPWVLLKHLQPQGVSIRALTRQRAIDRHTVLRALRREGRPPYTRTTRRASKLDAYHPYLERRRMECPELTAVRLDQEIQVQGDAGRWAILRNCLRPLRQEHRRLGQLMVRFETAPGDQGQVEGGHFGTILQPGQRCPLYGCGMVLGYSRARFVHCTTTQRLEPFRGDPGGACAGAPATSRLCLLCSAGPRGQAHPSLGDQLSHARYPGADPIHGEA